MPQERRWNFWRKSTTYKRGKRPPWRKHKGSTTGELDKSLARAFKRKKAFTLIELVIALAIVFILAAVAIPEFGQLVRKAQEADTKGNLASLRAALSIYYGDNGTFPQDMASLQINSKYIAGIPRAYFPTHHAPGNDIASGDNAAFLASYTESAHWWYYDDTDPQWGRVLPNCIHDDAKGVTWSTY